MVNTTQFPNVEGPVCGCCTTADEMINNYGCKEKLGVFTPREQTVLARIREIAAQGRRLKQRIGELRRAGANAADLNRLDEQWAELRRERNRLEQERLDAAAERMRWLGHA